MAQQTIQVADKPTLDELKASIDNATYGLQALKTLIDSNAQQTIESLINHEQYGLRGQTIIIDEIYSKIEHSTYGLNAIRNKLNTLGVVIKSVQRGYVNYNTKLDKRKYAGGNSDNMMYGIDITISSINVSKSFIIVKNITDLNASRYIEAAGEILNSTTITIWQHFTNTLNEYYLASMPIFWQVIEFY